MLTRVIGNCDTRVTDDPLQLLAEGQRGGETQHSRVPRSDAERRDGRDDRATRGRNVRDRRSKVALHHLVNLI